MTATLDQTTPARSRIDWRRALRAINALRAQTDAIQYAYEVMIALDAGQMEAMYQRFLAEPGAATLLAEKPSLLATLADFEALRPKARARRAPADDRGLLTPRPIASTARTGSHQRRASASVAALFAPAK